MIEGFEDDFGGESNHDDVDGIVVGIVSVLDGADDASDVWYTS